MQRSFRALSALVIAGGVAGCSLLPPADESSDDFSKDQPNYSSIQVAVTPYILPSGAIRYCSPSSAPVQVAYIIREDVGTEIVAYKTGSTLIGRMGAEGISQGTYFSHGKENIIIYQNGQRASLTAPEAEDKKGIYEKFLAQCRGLNSSKTRGDPDLAGAVRGQPKTISVPLLPVSVPQ